MVRNNREMRDDEYNNNNTSTEEEIEEEEVEKMCNSKSSWKSHLISSKNFLLICSRTDSLSTQTNTQGLIFHPDSWWYLIWKQFILIWAIYSSFFTPLEFGFFRGLPEDLFLLDIAGQFAFLIDIIVHFFVAYRESHSHRMIYNQNLISLRYLKSRFLVDLLGCLPWDAIYKACGRKEGVRYLLWIRLSRALRVTEFFEKLEKDIRINYLFTRIVKLFVVELYCTHTAACIFYYLATTLPASEEGFTWIGSLKMGEYSYSHFREIDLWTRYITSLYFAIVTMATLGYGDIHAVNTREMIFIMIYVSFDMILGAYLLGNMAALIVKGSRTERFRDKMTDVIKYMNRKKLGRNISNEIKGHLRLQYEINCSEPAVLQDIPVSFRAKISQKLYEPYLKEVLLFKGCSVGFIKQLATKAHEEFFLPGEVIIEQGHVVDQLYIICHGKLELGKSEGGETEESQMRLQTYSSLGEISVLCNIPVPFTVIVHEFSRLLRIDKQSLIDILEIYFSDGRTIINNILEGKESSLRNKILEADITLDIEKHESELAMRLNCAAFYGDLFRVKQLVEAGANPDNTDYDGRSALHLAASKGHEDITRFIIQKESRINIRDNYGNTPLFEAIKNGHDEVVALLVKAGASLSIDDAGNCLCTAVARGDLDFLRRVLANGINPNSKNYDLRTPLHLAASEGLYTMAHVLVEAGASVFAKDRWGNTPLDEARVGGNRKLINLLERTNCAQLSEFSDGFKLVQDKTRRRKCTVFLGNPWDDKEKRRQGVVVWVPDKIEDLIKSAQEQFKVTSDDCCILSEDGGKIVDVGLICDDQKLFLVSESIDI